MALQIKEVRGMKFIENMVGWRVYEDPGGPVTGRFRALRFGVSMSGGNLEQIREMIRTHDYERRTGWSWKRE
jgi:hypothetical protein